MILDPTNRTLRDIVLGGDEYLRARVRTDSFDLRVREFGVPVAFTVRMASFAASIFVVAVAVCKEQMRRIYARRDIATMRDYHAVRNWADFNFPHDAVRSFDFAATFYDAVTVFISVTVPQPAVRPFGVMSRKPFARGQRGNFVQRSCVPPPVVAVRTQTSAHDSFRGWTFMAHSVIPLKTRVYHNHGGGYFAP